ncbi:MAG: FtsX-like permease family protein [Cellulophaga sp.]
MIRNYFKIAFRNLWNNKVFSLINIIGLSIGFSASFVIGILVYYDLTFDKFHPDSDRIYRVTTNFSSPEGAFYNRGVPIPLGKALKESMPDIELVSAFFDAYPFKIENKEAGLTFKNLDNLIYADESYFQLFKYEWLAGTPNGILTNPNEVVLTNTRSSKYFPKLSPSEILGKTLIYNDSIPLKVTGIVANFKERTDLIFQEFISPKTALNFGAKNQVFNEEWGNTNSSTQVFIKMIAGGKTQNLQQYLNKLAKEHVDSWMLEFKQKRVFHLQPLSDVHFNANYGVFNNSTVQASKSVLISLSFIALFLLLLGCINFINLNTATATKRAKEIGIRKTLGSSKKQLVFQFMGETFLLTITATLLSLFLSVWLLKLFSSFIPEGVSFSLFKNPVVLISMAALLLVVTILSGFYPALVLSFLKPVSIFKNQVLSDTNKTPLRKYLTVFQFVIAQIFIIATILVGKQINYLMTKDMGFKTEAVASIRMPWQDHSMDKRLRFIKEVEALPQILNTSLGGNPPASFSTSSTTITYFNDNQKIQTSLELLYGDQNYLDLYHLKLLAGRDRLNDTIHEYVINETYLKILGFENPSDAIGEILMVNEERNPIVGVIADFNQRSLKMDIKPMALVGDRYRSEHIQFNTAHLSIQAKNTAIWPETITKIENIWKAIYPEADMELHFIDESLKRFYRQEQKMATLLNWSTGLAILISCLGLFGLVIHNTERRTKEIGIRKVLGASLAQLNLLLSKEFLTLVGIAFVIAAPIAWYGLHNWLEDFAYKTTLSWWVFILSGVVMLGLALIIISIKTIASANVNPVKSLRTE